MTKQNIREKQNGMQRVSLILTKEDHKRLKLVALQKDKSMMDLIREMIQHYLLSA